LHFVHFNKKYGNDLNEAITNGAGAQDTLAVLGVLIEVGDSDNEAYEHITQGIRALAATRTPCYVHSLLCAQLGSKVM
jgi:hypothetical protein